VDEPVGLRERKKARTRRRIAEAAVRLFAERGFEATTIESICAEAEVAVSTFYVYFDSKEGAAFPDEDERAALVAATLRERPHGEPLHVTLRRASHTVAQRDVGARDALAGRVAFLAREPALAAHAARLQAGYVEQLSAVLADEMAANPRGDVRPRLLISAAFGALNAAWAAWAGDGSRDLVELIDEAHDVLDAGFAQALQPQRQTAR
jgi:AcrR family transcriptional regulator